MQGAGGIGGLIATVDGAADYLYCVDANGNVGQVVNAADGAIAAKYEYDPFGKPVKADGAYAGENLFRFSTKYHDDETGLVYYGYRYYSAELGRWTSRDPFEEDGGNNLYLFAVNDSINWFDTNGLFIDQFKGQFEEYASGLNKYIEAGQEKVKEQLRQTRIEVMEKFREIRDKAKLGGNATYTLQERYKIPVGQLFEWNYGLKATVKESPCKIQIQAGLFGGGRIKTPRILWGANVVVAFSINGVLGYEYLWTTNEEDSNGAIKVTVVPVALRWGVGKKAWGFGAEGFAEIGLYGAVEYKFLSTKDVETEELSGGIGGYARAVWEIGTKNSVSRFEEKFSIGYGIDSGMF